MSKLRLNIVRGNQEDGQKNVEYEVPYSDGMSLLDAILWLRKHEDPTIAVRYSCRSANACKECMAVIDKKPGYLCSIKAVEDSTVNIEPLKGLPWLKDLTTILE